MNPELKDLLHNYFNSRNSLYQRLAAIIGYENEDNLHTSIVTDDTDMYWTLTEDCLRLYDSNNDDYWEYIVSSYSSKKIKFYTGNTETYTIILAYPEDKSWNDALIFVLSNDHKLLPS